MAGQAEKQQGIEYTIYTYAMKKDGAQSQGTLTEMGQALSQAEQLLASKKYCKVEVKQKYFDKKQNRDINTTLKVYESKRIPLILIIAVFAVMLCAGAGTGYFMAHR
ncbi:MAG: hypothetical protein H6867_03065 [Rhodospirillales bacterium]|nr:hypothetical protein [Rhodospirillales bacterium]MCB9996131.1 hypothetical protein [Rhodospirillales bacterium]